MPANKMTELEREALRKTYQTFPEPVFSAILKRWPECYRDILAKVQWDSLNGCYYVAWAGMYVGIETDGYIHT